MARIEDIVRGCGEELGSHLLHVLPPRMRSSVMQRAPMHLDSRTTSHCFGELREGGSRRALGSGKTA